MLHIVADKPTEPRGDKHRSELTVEERYKKLILF